jgi:hypothetical protein
MLFAIAIDHQILQYLAWTFTVLSAVISIAFSLYRFGLSPFQRMGAIIGAIIVGVAISILLLSDASPLKRFKFINAAQFEQIQTAHDKDGTHSSGFIITKDGGVQDKAAGGTVNRVSDYIYAVIHPKGTISAVYNGGFFDAEINGRVENCELIDIGDNRVLIIRGGQLETFDLGSTQTTNTFKVQKVPVSRNP